MLTQEKRKELYKHLKNFETRQVLIDAELIGFKILPFIQRGIRNHTSHGTTHSMKVIEYTNKIIEILSKHGLKLSQTEIELLYIAGWLHDIGNIKNRENHSIESCKIIRNYLEGRYINLGKLLFFLEYIITFHQSNFDLAKVPHKEYKIGNDVIRLHLLCAIFRLADACHMGEDRAFKLVFDILKDDLGEDSTKHWEANESIISLNFKEKEKTIEILVIDKKIAKILTDKFKTEFDNVKEYLKEYFPFEKIVVEEIPKMQIENMHFSK